MKNAAQLHPIILAAASSPKGCRAADIKLGTVKDFHAATLTLLRQGKLWKVKISHKVVVYFAHQHHATDYERALNSRPVSVITPTKTFHKDAVVVVPPNVKITIGPSFPERVLRTNTHSKM